MGSYVFAPAGPQKQRSTLIKACVEQIGAQQVGFGSNYAKGRRYLKSKLHCSGTAIKRAVSVRPKVLGNDFETYGVDVYYYHVDFCVDILKEVIDYVKASNEIQMQIFDVPPKEDEYSKCLYGHRISQLCWVRDEDYQGQREQAAKLIDKFQSI